MDKAMDQLDELLPSRATKVDDEPSTERQSASGAKRRVKRLRGRLTRETEPSAPLSALSVRLSDGALFVSLEDAGDRDLRGREVSLVLRLNDDEILDARECLTETSDDIAARVIGRLPKRTT